MENKNRMTADSPRDMWGAIRRGWSRLCPSCGKAGLMESYLTVRETCPVCGTALHHHRADDGPAWATIVVTGHLLAPVMLFVFTTWRPEGWVMALGFSVAFVALSLFLLPRFKGVFVGMQWAKRMHGFGERQEPATND